MMDNEERRYPMSQETMEALERRGIDLVAIYKGTDPDLLNTIESVVNAFGVYMTPGSWDRELGEIREWLFKMRSLDRRGMR